MGKKSTSSFTPEQEVLFSLLGHSLFDRDLSLPENVDWMAVYREAFVQTVGLQAFHKSPEYGIPSETEARIKQTLRRFMMRDAAVHAAHKRVHELMTQNGIPYVIIKGAASAYYYPAPFLRGMGDVDFYVPDAWNETALGILTRNGFTVTENSSVYHTVLMERGVKYELHREIPGVPKGEAGNLVRKFRDGMTEQGIFTQTDSAVFNRPSPFHHGLILLLHTQQHLLNEGLGLRHLCDWAVFVASFPEDEFLRLMKEKLTYVGLWTFARILSLAAVIAVGLEQRDWMTQDQDDGRLALSLLQDFLSGGNFGAKDGDRSRVYESKLISNQEKSRLDRSRAGNAMESVNNWIRERWPAAKTCPLLLPFGWIYFLLRRFWLVMTGKKKRIEMKKTLENSSRRQDLYKRLRLFQLK